MARTEAKETPMMQQHREIKERYPDAILLFRVGDFYETFGGDAINASRILGITLTKRSNGAAAEMELAGFPHHALDTYLHKLVKAGFRVAICDQLEDPKLAKGLVKRGVTEMVSPGVAANDKILDGLNNNFLAALNLSEGICGVAFIDISTGEFYVGEGNLEYIDKLLQSFGPSEIVLAKSKVKLFREKLDNGIYTFPMEDWVFAERYTYDSLLQHFGTNSLKGFGIEEMKSATIAAGAALHYLKDTAHPNLQHISGIHRIINDSFLWMDRFTIRNLELLPGAENAKSLLQALDVTLSPMGARLLKRWMVFPLFDIHQIRQRHNWVELLITHVALSAQLGQHLRQTGDVERLVSKIPLKKASPREILALAKSLGHMAAIKELCQAENDPSLMPLQQLCQNIQACLELQKKIEQTIKEDAPALAAKGNMIREGINETLDELRKISRNGKDYLLQIQQREMERTQISSLKVAYNNVFGYYLEVTHAHKNKVPNDWIRKQTLTNAERYITPELKEYEDKILGAEEKMLALELTIYGELLNSIEPFIVTIQQNAATIAILDCLLAFANQAKRYHYRKPEMVEDPILDIKDGRHPVIEQSLPPGEHYIANDLLLDKEQQQIIILTGPNMSGKSALLRQTAIITLMAHMGSFVPASAATIGITDKIFTRVGASDNLSGGESTFMVEMNETASIINSISSRSLVLLDEIGRGTSTYDGISLAWSIAEFLHNSPSHPKVLFATHYHELHELESSLPRLRNYHITHQESGNKIIFLRKLALGGSRHSFGIQVARMAGMPPDLLERAEELLTILEEKHGTEPNEQVGKTIKQSARKANNKATYQLNIFDGIGEDMRRIRQLLDETDINTLTPVEALMKLNEMKRIADNYQ